LVVIVIEVPINPIIQSRTRYYSSRNPEHVTVHTHRQHGGLISLIFSLRKESMLIVEKYISEDFPGIMSSIETLHFMTFLPAHKDSLF
jgi:hypothetical protein